VTSVDPWLLFSRGSKTCLCQHAFIKVTVWFETLFREQKRKKIKITNKQEMDDGKLSKKKKEKGAGEAYQEKQTLVL